MNLYTKIYYAGICPKCGRDLMTIKKELLYAQVFCKRCRKKYGINKNQLNLFKE